MYMTAPGIIDQLLRERWAPKTFHMELVYSLVKQDYCATNCPCLNC